MIPKQTPVRNFRPGAPRRPPLHTASPARSATGTALFASLSSSHGIPLPGNRTRQKWAKRTKRVGASSTFFCGESLFSTSRKPTTRRTDGMLHDFFLQTYYIPFQGRCKQRKALRIKGLKQFLPTLFVHPSSCFKEDENPATLDSTSVAGFFTHSFCPITLFCCLVRHGGAHLADAVNFGIDRIAIALAVELCVFLR